MRWFNATTVGTAETELGKRGAVTLCALRRAVCCAVLGHVLGYVFHTLHRRYKQSAVCVRRWTDAAAYNKCCSAGTARNGRVPQWLNLGGNSTENKNRVVT